MSDNDPLIQKIMSEINQNPDSRANLFTEITNKLGRPLLAYFTSLTEPVMIDDTDADIIAGILQGMDLSNGLALMISSNGGNGLAAERIIRICKSFSKTGEFWTIVPGRAKSAGTMICLGSSKILMFDSSELGPIDPQIVHKNNRGETLVVSAIHEKKTYEELFNRAVLEKNRLEPYLQQLERYDPTEISHLTNMIELSKDIAIKALAQGMMAGCSADDIYKKINLFLSPESTKTHGRPIFSDEAAGCGLQVENLDARDGLGSLIFELFIRIKFFAETRAYKVIENGSQSFVVERKA